MSNLPLYQLPQRTPVLPRLNAYRLLFPPSNMNSTPSFTTALPTASSPPTDLSDKPDRKLLSTLSPEAIRVASQITPTRLANLLIRRGPLPIRHITSQLALEVPGFDHLSLSKQRRLIMAAMEQSDSENNVVFEKIGWGQWAVRRIDSDYIVTEGTEGTTAEDTKINVHDLRNQVGLKLGWSKKQKPKPKARRESITTKNNPHNVEVPKDPVTVELDLELSEDDYALEESDSESEDDEDLFAFDEDESTIDKFKRTRLPPIKFANRVPIKISPPPGGAPQIRRKLSLAANSSVNKNTSYRQHIFSRLRLNSYENLDNYIVSSAKNSGVLVSLPPIGSPNLFNNNYIHHNYGATSPDSIAATMNQGRRKSSFNESHIRSTLSSSLPQHPQVKNAPESDTDEEDWRSIGAESLRRATGGSNQSPNDADERAAAFALVDLMSV